LRFRRIPTTETRGFCHDCHNTARVEILLSHRAPIRLCDRCGSLFIFNLGEIIIPRLPKNLKHKQ